MLKSIIYPFDILKHMEYLIEELVGQLRTQREALGLSQREVAERAHMPQSHYSRVERAAVSPRLASFVELARVLDLELVLVPRKVLPAIQVTLKAAAGESSSAASKPAYALDSDEEDTLEKARHQELD